MNVKHVSVLDQGDGNALANYASNYPRMVAAVLSSLKETTGVDVSGILAGTTEGRS